MLLSASLVFYLTKWNSYPPEIGIHFDSDGQYDVIASKVYGFYPHVIGGICIAGTAFSNFLIQKKSTGLKITEKGEQHFKTELCLTLDCLSVLLSLFFANWSRTVSLQIPLNIEFMVNLELCIMAVSGIGIVSEVITCLKYKIQDKSDKNPQLMHRLCRLIAWLMTTAGAVLLAVIWERLPIDEELYNNPEYYGLAYFANLDTYLDKHLLLIPHSMIVLLLVIFEILSVKAEKAENYALSAFADKMKVVCSIFFFWWNMLIEWEIKISISSVCLFAGFCILFFVTYLKKRKSDA